VGSVRTSGGERRRGAGLHAWTVGERAGRDHRESLRREKEERSAGRRVVGQKSRRQARGGRTERGEARKKLRFVFRPPAFFAIRILDIDERTSGGLVRWCSWNSRARKVEGEGYAAGATTFPSRKGAS